MVSAISLLTSQSIDQGMVRTTKSFGKRLEWNGIKESIEKVSSDVLPYAERHRTLKTNLLGESLGAQIHFRCHGARPVVS